MTWHPHPPYTATFPKARKKHSCCECAAPIMQGEFYEKIACMNEDRYWFEFKTCWPCLEVRQDFQETAQFDDEVPQYGELADYLERGP